MEFGICALGFSESELRSMPAFRLTETQDQEEADLLLCSKVLAYSNSTWSRYISVLKDFQSFCRIREVNPLDCTPSTLNIYLLHLGQNGKSIGRIETFVAALSFFYKFYLIRADVVDLAVSPILRFLKKVCPRKSNKKAAFGSTQIRVMWDAINAKKGGIENLNPVELRTFVIAVFQHATFCRFSDISQLKLSDLFYDLDYFKVSIQFSKTDQTGIGQVAFLPKASSGVRDPHSLMCLYLSSVHQDQNDSVFLFPPFK